jgi:hypothetical protein
MVRQRLLAYPAKPFTPEYCPAPAHPLADEIEISYSPIQDSASG